MNHTVCRSGKKWTLSLIDQQFTIDGCKSLGLAGQEKSDLVEYLKSLPNTPKHKDSD